MKCPWPDAYRPSIFLEDRNFQSPAYQAWVALKNQAGLETGSKVPDFQTFRNRYEAGERQSGMLLDRRGRAVVPLAPMPSGLHITGSAASAATAGRDARIRKVAI